MTLTTPLCGKYSLNIATVNIFTTLKCQLHLFWRYEKNLQMEGSTVT